MAANAMAGFKRRATRAIAEGCIRPKGERTRVRAHSSLAPSVPSQVIHP